MRRVLSLSMLALLVVGLVWLSRSARLGPGATGGAVVDAAADAPPASESEHARPELPANEQGAREPREATTAPSRSAPFAGRLIDASTGEAVPWYALELSDPEANELRVTSDGDGRFLLSGLTPGRYRTRSTTW